MGDKVNIKVVAANLLKRQLDYEWVVATSMKEEHEMSASAQERIKGTQHKMKSAKTFKTVKKNGQPGNGKTGKKNGNKK